MTHRSQAAPSGFAKAIILDLDDTILDSGDPDVSWRRVSSEFAGDFEGVAPDRSGLASSKAATVSILPSWKCMERGTRPPCT